MSDPDSLQQQADLIRASGVLGKPGSLTRLFDYLLERSLAGEAPKEIEIAVHAFGKKPDFDVAQDSAVRVYVHKLRRRLDEYYAQPQHAGQLRMVVPKGEYRLVLEHSATEAIASPVDPSAPTSIPTPRRIRQPLLFAAAILLAMAIGALLTWLVVPQGEDDEMLAVRESVVWSPLLDDDLPITIVVGDYYLLGEEDDAGNVTRLVREFFVNSNTDYLEHLEANPELMRRYRDLGLQYLPVSAAAALTNIAPVVRTSKPVRVMLASDLTAEMLKTTHIIYVGYLSGLGMMGDPVFAASRLALGGTYDELVDSRSNATYTATGASTGNVRYTDYGYFSTFIGPRRNQIVIVSGTRDGGVAQTAEALTDSRFLASIAPQVVDAQSFEGLSEVRGMNNTSMSSRLLFVSPLQPPAIWDVE